MVTRKDYNQIAVNAAYSVLIEVTRILSEYRDNIVLIGGWVPQFLFQNESEMHTGSIDIDLALDHRQITDDGYKGIHDLVGEFRPHLKNNLVQEGLRKLAKSFASEEHTGPKFVTAFEEITDEEDRVQMERDAFERANYLLQKLGIV